MTRTILLAALVLGIAAALEAKPHAEAVAGVFAIDVFADGSRMHLLVAETTSDEGARLFHRTSVDGGVTWSESRRVDAAMPPPFSPHRGFDPQIAAAGDLLVAAWTTAGTDRWGSGPIATARSEDGGVTWRQGPNPADDGLTTGHGFLDLAVDAEGAFHLVWLDSRDGRQGLRHAKSSDGGASWSPNRTLQAGTCECCRNTLATGPDGTVAVLFRGHDPRDMKVISSKNNEWREPLTAGDFAWKFDGCPHAGGGLAVTAAALHALVWTGSETHAGVHYVRPGGAAHRLGDPSATHPDLAATREGVLLAVWQERNEEGVVLRHTLSDDEGANWSDPQSIARAAATATHPRVVAGRDGFLIVWTETPEGAAARWSSAWIPASRP
ncbi:MAG: exo-alpha-sialidase [Verrucomicrobiaceae bacterium]|nr:exo-alpha-sialidase [Verrucomicrobiaceae bacterium]